MYTMPLPFHIRPRKVLALLCLALATAAGAVEPLPFEPDDTLEDIRYKIEHNGYDFKVTNTWVYSLPPSEKKAMFNRRAPAWPRTAADAADMGPVVNYLQDSLPTAFCWTNVAGSTYIGPIRDQGGCGSCYSFGAAAAAEGTYNKALGLTDGNCADFSESFIAWCLGSISPYSSHFYGCDGADYDYYELEALTVEGICFEADFPYVQSDPGSCTHWEDPRAVFDAWHRIPCGDVDAIKAALFNYGVVDAAVYVTSAFESYAGGIYQDTSTNCSDTTPCYYKPTNHAISLVGWNDNEGDGYWILRNSWGTSWGEDGYMRISYHAAVVSCEACYLVYTATVEAPSAITGPAQQVTTNSAVLTGQVNPGGQATSFRFEYGPSTSYGSSTPWQSAGDGAYFTTHSNTVTGLSENQPYHFRLVATNASGTALGSDETFTPRTAPVVVFHEDFEAAGGSPAGWSQEAVAGTTLWTFVSGDGGNDHPSSAYEGAYNAYFGYEGYSDQRRKLVSPAVDLTGATNEPTLHFQLHNGNWLGDQDVLKVYYKTSAGGTWTLLETYANDVSTWTEQTVALPDVNATYYLSFEGDANYGYGVCVDDLRITAYVAANTTPQAAIEQPTPGWTFTEGVPIVFRGSGFDTEEGTLSGSSLVWTSNLDQVIGTGSCVTSGLSAGTQLIVLTASDAQGAAGRDTVSLTIDADTDGDQMPDWWEEAYSGSATGLTATADDDNDGADNLHEWLGGSEPDTAASSFTALGQWTPGSGNTIRWNATSNRHYSIWWSTNLSGDFQLLASNLINQSSVTDQVHGAEQRMFYKIQAEP